MKKTAIWIISLSTLMLIVVTCTSAYADYLYSRQIGSYWELSVKASSLDAKTAYLDKYVAALQSATLANHDAIIFKTPNNSLEQNMHALLSLQKRMHEIEKMDVTSFQYQQAMMQITGQEQDEAGDMIGTLQECWTLRHFPVAWNWIGGMLVTLGLLGSAVTGALWFITH